MFRVVIFLLLCSCSAAEIRVRSATWAQPMIGSELKNWHKIDDHLYRSAQPDSDDMKMLEKFGITEVLTLRDFHDDKDEVKKTTLKAHRIEMSAGSVTTDQVVEALKIIRAAKGPVLVHCWHGSDRTGTVVAFYRILEQGWKREDALDEMQNGGFGFHASIYGNLPKLILSADLEAMRAKLNTTSP